MNETQNYLENIRSNLKKLIDARESSVESCAQNLGISVPSLHRYLNGSRNPHIDNIIKMATYFDVSVDWLLGRSDSFDGLSEETVELINLYSSASESDRKVIDAVLEKYREKNNG